MALEEASAGWQGHAACRGEDSSFYFAPSYFEKRGEKLAREAVAKRICA
ncbi:MAG: Transcription factor WhiB, partial [Actinomycetia bacterium]|nr:Transcription factor WhiB [Actinomycetes bacterium]